jgi:glutamate decarboxylase
VCCRPQGLLLSCNQMSAEYLFMQDKLYDVKYDTGDKVIQCGRHNDIFKLWLQWRAKVQCEAFFGCQQSTEKYL